MWGFDVSRRLMLRRISVLISNMNTMETSYIVLGDLVPVEGKLM